MKNISDKRLFINSLLLWKRKKKYIKNPKSIHKINSRMNAKFYKEEEEERSGDLFKNGWTYHKFFSNFFWKLQIIDYLSFYLFIYFISLNVFL